MSAEVVVIAALPLRGTDSDANVQMRGVSQRVLQCATTSASRRAAFCGRACTEIVVGTNAAKAYQGLDLGATVRIGPGSWTVVGILDAGGSAFDSEIWADADVLNGNYARPAGVFQSVTARLRSVDAFPAFEKAVKGDPRLEMQASREQDTTPASRRWSARSSRCWAAWSPP